MADYAYLNKLPPSAFLDWRNFITEYDAHNGKEKADAQYQKGFIIGKKNAVVGVGAGGTWWAQGRPEQGCPMGSSTTSYEGIGYHANTADFWRGVLDSGCKIVIMRHDAPDTVIREAV
jgi:hypothetical protein